MCLVVIYNFKEKIIGPISWEQLKLLPSGILISATSPLVLQDYGQNERCRSTYYFVYGGILTDDEQLTVTTAETSLCFLTDELQDEFSDVDCHGLRFANLFGSLHSRQGEHVKVAELQDWLMAATLRPFTREEMCRLFHTCFDLYVGYDKLRFRGIEDVQRKAGCPLFLRMKNYKGVCNEKN